MPSVPPAPFGTQTAPASSRARELPLARCKRGRRQFRAPSRPEPCVPQDRWFGAFDRSFGAFDRWFRSHDRPFGANHRPFGARGRWFGENPRSFGTQDRSFGADHRSFGAHGRWFRARGRHFLCRLQACFCRVWHERGGSGPRPNGAKVCPPRHGWSEPEGRAQPVEGCANMSPPRRGGARKGRPDPRVALRVAFAPLRFTRGYTP